MVGVRAALIYALAALAEIGGCFAVWSVLRHGAARIWLAVGLVSLAAFAVLLAHSDSLFAGRAYAAYGGVYIVASLLWLWAVEGGVPRGTDILGGAICLTGAAIIVWGGRA